jgi:cell wall-associated NlpC family hydrolase
MALAACAGTSLQPQSHTPGGPQAAPRAADPRAILVDVAASMLGQPYRWGGAAPGGFDCSGLVAYAASGAGIRVPRTAHEQLRAGTPVARAELQAGDLVFMHLEHKELHVGIVIGGERFIHAPSAGGQVRIDSLAAPPYSRSFLAARRIISVR